MPGALNEKGASWDHVVRCNALLLASGILADDIAAPRPVQARQVFRQSREVLAQQG